MEGCLRIGLKLTAVAWLVLRLGPSANAQDCNLNGVPDAQDIAVGTSEDCNGDGVPDECGMYRVQRLPISGLVAHDSVGRTVAVRGDLALIGAPGDSSHGVGAGAVYALRFVAGNWVQEQKLVPSDAPEHGSFGGSIAMSADLAVIGAYGRDTLRGAAYVFRRVGDTWVEEQILTASDAADYDYFGIAVAAGNDVIWVGANRLAESVGTAAYVFRWNGTDWAEELKIDVPEGAGSFGSAIALEGDVAVVGDGFVAEGCVGTGAYVFRWDGAQWQYETKLEPLPGDEDACFGSAVAISGGVIWVGVPGVGHYSGAAYVYRWDGASWGQPTRLTSADREEMPEYGASVVVDGNLAVVGAPLADQGVDWGGAAYLYRWNGAAWRKEAKLTPSDLASGDDFGQAVAIDGGRALIGAPAHDEPGDHAGAAYVVNIPEPTALLDCNYNEIPDECEIAEGTSTDCNVNGFLDECEFRDGVSADCNGNGILDECDIAGGASRDCDGNGVPDECEWYQEANLDPDNGGYGYQFGVSVAAEDDVLVVGSPGAQYSYYTQAGTARVFRLYGTTWIESAPLYAETPGFMEHFGCSVAIGGGRIVVGAYHDDGTHTDMGTARVFTWTGTDWGLGSLLIASDRSHYAYFGQSVAVSGDVAVVGAPGWGEQGTNPGAVYVYRWNGTNWAETKLLASGLAGAHEFGYKVAIDGDTLVASVRRYQGLWGSGAVYVFRWNGGQWLEEAKLKGSGANDYDRFGDSVSIVGDVLAVGAHGKDDKGDVSGMVYIFRRSGAVWIEEAKLTASDTETQDHFGCSVSLDGDLLLVGADGDDGREPNSGLIYLFRHNGTGWTELARLTAADGAEYDGFGAAVGLRGQTLVAGAPSRMNTAGSAYAYRFHDLDWDRTLDICDLCPATIGGVPVDINGCPPLVQGDSDRDGDVDRTDLAAFEACAIGPAISQADPDCTWARFDADDDVDQSDFAVFQRCFNGKSNPADPACSQ